MFIDQQGCHGTKNCLQRSSKKLKLNALIHIHQKVRSYIVWWLENVGWRGTTKHVLTRPFKLKCQSSSAFIPSKSKTQMSVNGEVLGLQPGELVEVKSIEEILATLDDNRRHKGLRWMTGMRQHCGKQYKVLKRLEKIMLEDTGEMRNMKNTVLLKGAMCDGVEFGGCDRSCHHFWREIWLKRIDGQ